MDETDIDNLRRQLGSMGTVGKQVLALFERDLRLPQRGFPNLSDAFVAALARELQGQRVLDAGSGTGYLAYRLAEAGIDVLACDIEDYNAHREVEPRSRRWKLDVQGDALDLLPGFFDVILLSWPSFGTPFAAEVTRRLAPGQLLFYLGERQGGCTANDDFFISLRGAQWAVEVGVCEALNAEYRSDAGMRDKWIVWRRL